MFGQQDTCTGLRRTTAAGTALSTAALCTAIAITPALAQEAGGLLFTFGLSTTLSADDNANLSTGPVDGTILSETQLRFGFESITRTQALRLSLSDTLRAGDGPGAPAKAGFRGPNVELSYERKGANSSFDFAASQTTRNLNTDLTEIDPESTTDLILDSGTLTTRNLGFGLKTGLDAPVGTELSLSENRRSYIDTTDPDLYDSSTRKAVAALLLRPDTETEMRLAYTHTDYRAEDVSRTERQTRNLSFGVTRQLDPATKINGSIGWSDVTETLTAIPLALPDRSGLTASLGYSRELSGGGFSAELAHDITSAGGLTKVSLTRGYELPTGELTFVLGATKVDGNSVQPTGSIAYTREIQTQAISLSLSSDVSVNSDSLVQRSTVADVGYSKELNKRDSLALNFDYVWITGADSAAVTDQTRATATASYNRDLTPDWTLTTGYTHRLKREEGSGTARSNTLFMTLARDFSWRP